MNERQRYVFDLCEAAIAALKEVDSEIAAGSLSEHILWELEQMKAALDPEIFAPSYGRPIIDCHEGPLADQLLEVSYQYGRIRKRGRLRQGRPDGDS
jgi:hypothetical protein